MFQGIRSYLQSTTKAAPLAAFRILFGLLMFVSLIRFALNGWIEKLYIEPKFFFHYYGFEFVKPLGNFTYLIFFICAIASLGVALGYKYRLSIIVFFLSFTYIELMDLTTYLNHYYFISIISFVMIFLPANAYFSYDAYKNPRRAFEYVPNWTIDVIKLLLSIVYFYAGLAKLNSDWIIYAMPLSIWLPSAYDLPFLGEFLQQRWLIYLFSWSGAVYDLSIPFLLFYKKTRWYAFFLVIVFHLLTGALFPIGMFPYIMIAASTIFFESKWHQKAINYLAGLLKISLEKFDNALKKTESFSMVSRLKLSFLGLFLLLQLLFPFRYLAYPGELFWTEEGYRFSWRVMLMEKAANAQFKISEPQSGIEFYVDNSKFLSGFQEKQMSGQPDMILQYAHFLKAHYEKQGMKNVEVYADVFVALNGRKSKRYISPEIDLSKINDSFAHKNWILKFDDEISGF
ncbi:HTTM domain-containing protein [Hyphobacterium sp. CCMP332]|nr:HTTM domain-containing protein [Hyphobacterium sp. CCMP332]